MAYRDVWAKTLNVQGKATFHTPIKANFQGPLTGEVIGNLRGCVVGDLEGDVVSHKIKTVKLKTSQIEDSGDGLGLSIEQVKLQKGTVTADVVNVGTLLQATQITETPPSTGFGEGVCVEGVICKNKSLSCHSLQVSGTLKVNKVGILDSAQPLDIAGVQFTGDGEITGVENTKNRGAANGYCDLDERGIIPSYRIPNFPLNLCGVLSNSGNLESANNGSIFVTTEPSEHFGKQWNPGDIALRIDDKWEKLQLPGSVNSVNGKVGDVQISLQDLRITSEIGDMLVDDGSKVVRMPRGAPGQTLTSVKGGLMWLNSTFGSYVWMNKSQTITLPNNVPQRIERWSLHDRSPINDEGMFDLVQGICKIPQDGRYLIDLNIIFDKSNFNQMCKVDIVCNDQEIIEQEIVQSDGNSIGNSFQKFVKIKLFTICQLNRGDNLTVNVVQANEGGDKVNVGSHHQKSRLIIYKL
jgi:hypothetical protein